jgi:Spy/CpxP family protein refolding chaperone
MSCRTIEEGRKEVMRMKKLVIAVLAMGILTVAISGVHAFGRNFGPCGGDLAATDCMNYTNLTPEQKAKMEEFRKETLPLREQMMAKRSELMALRQQANPDWTAIGDKQKEMAELRTQMQKKAFDAGFAGMGGGRGQCGGPGMGMMKGRMM